MYSCCLFLYKSYEQTKEGGVVRNALARFVLGNTRDLRIGGKLNNGGCDDAMMI